MNPEEDTRGGRRSRVWYPGDGGGGNSGWGKIGGRSPNKQYIYEDQYISQTRTRDGDDGSCGGQGRCSCQQAVGRRNGMAVCQRHPGKHWQTGKLYC